ncbi:MAG: phosphoribosyl-AMP cyclohydrolase [Ectothiorhodospiraceae bacterium]
MKSEVDDTWLDALAWGESGLLPAVAQDADSGEVLMLAWMNRDALAATVAGGEAVYWSRSRACFWRKGETSGHTQAVREVRLDCDGDTILLRVDQRGGIACHTGRPSCFFRRLVNGAWEEAAPVTAISEEPDRGE